MQNTDKPFAVATTLPNERPTPPLVTTSTVIRICLTIIGVALLAYAVYKVLAVLLLLLIAVMLATAIEPVVTKLRRGPFSRSQGVLIVYTAIFAVLVAIGWLIIPVFINQVGEVVQNLPASIRSFQQWAAEIKTPFLGDQARQAANALAAVFDVHQAAPATPGSVGEQVANVSSVALSLAETVLSVILVFVIAFYWMTERTLVKRWLVSVLPADRGNRVRRVWDDIELKVGGWVRGQLTLMGVVGLISALGYFTIGVRYWPALALFIALAEAIPLVGPYIGTAPAILIALTQGGNDGLPLLLNLDSPGGLTRAILVAVFAVLLQTVEGNVLVPRIMRNSVGISALTVIVSLLIGSALAGLPGALLAVPIAGAIQVVVMDLRAAAVAHAEQEKRDAEAALVAAAKETAPQLVLPGVDEMPPPGTPAAHIILPGEPVPGVATAPGSPATPPAAPASATPPRKA
ncbi:MAG TPA: AI-2E family transporter [Chloroflexia bacterium]|nr:AI-2E family transporter [Chloroflexia bacterium]